MHCRQTLEGAAVSSLASLPQTSRSCCIPADRRYWAEPFAAVRRLWNARLNSYSHFAISGIPSGEYLVVLRESQEIGGSVPSTDWMEDTVLEDLARRGRACAWPTARRK